MSKKKTTAPAVQPTPAPVTISDELRFPPPPAIPEGWSEPQMRAMRSNPKTAHTRVEEVLSLLDEQKVSPTLRCAMTVLRKELASGVELTDLTDWAVTLVVGTFDVLNEAQWKELRDQTI